MVLGAAVLVLLIFMVSRGTGAPSKNTASVAHTVGQTEFTTLADGLQYKDLEAGTGDAAKEGDKVSVLYIGTLANGTEFDSSAKHNNTPIEVTLGAHQVIPGFEEALIGLKVGGKRTIVIPPSLGYPKEAAGRVPPELVDAELHFEVTRTK